MTAMLEHPIWTEDIVIRDPWLEEMPKAAMPGTIAIHWRGADGSHEVLLSGNDADDFMERYRAADEFQARATLLRSEIEKAIGT